MRLGNGDSRANDNAQDAEKMESIRGRSRDGFDGNGSSRSKIVSDIVYITSEDRSRSGGFYQNMVNSAPMAHLIDTRNRNQTQDRNFLHKRSMVFEASTPDHQHIQRITGSKHVLESDTTMRGNAKDLELLWSSRRARPKKLRLTKEQSALLEQSFKAGSTLNLV
jgi:hypothetical protein